MNKNKIHPKTTKCKGEVSRYFVNLDQAAYMLECSARTVRRRSDAGIIPPIVKMGHLSRISYQGLIAYIAKVNGKLGGFAL